jgi:hypothetical protein
MKKRYWLFSLLCPLFLPSCGLYDALFSDYNPQPTPDTIVLSIDPKRTEVQYLVSDSTYSIIRYWMGPYNNRLYKSLEEHYKRGRLIGDRYEWDSLGVLIHKSNWDEGVKVGQAYEWHHNGQLKQWIQFSPIGNREFETNFFDNGKKESDSIIYDGMGRRNSDIKYYDPTGYHTETFHYRNDTLLGVSIYKSMYITLERRGEALLAKRLRDKRMNDSLEVLRMTNPTAVEFAIDNSKVLRIQDDDTW